MNCFVKGPFQTDCGVVKLLFSQSQNIVDTNSRDQEGQTPLSWAIEYLPCTRVELPSVPGFCLIGVETVLRPRIVTVVRCCPELQKLEREW
jgi:hypothetical protein